MTPINDGFHANIPFEEYCAWDAMNASTLVHGIKSMAHLKATLDDTAPDKDTDAKAFGRALHVRLLEPHLYREEFVVADCDRRTKAGKEAYAQIVASGKTLLKTEIAEQLDAMVESAMSNPWVRDILNDTSQTLETEISMLWRDEETGVRCKGRLDLYRCDARLISDFKTAIDASSRVFGAAAARYNYHVRAALYVDGVRALTDPDATMPVFWILAMEKTPPYAVAPYCVDSAAIDSGRSIYREVLTRYKECQATGRWPGLNDDQPSVLSMPQWAYNNNVFEESAL